MSILTILTVVAVALVVLVLVVYLVGIALYLWRANRHLAKLVVACRLHKSMLNHYRST